LPPSLTRLVLKRTSTRALPPDPRYLPPPHWRAVCNATLFYSFGSQSACDRSVDPDADRLDHGTPFDDFQFEQLFELCG
jgi:hypothetical protein